MSYSEVLGGQGQLASTLGASVDTIDEYAVLTFQQYRRIVLPADGYVFWVRTDLLSPSAIPGAGRLGSFVPGAGSFPAIAFQAQGSLHRITLLRQDEAGTDATNRVVFTSKDEVRDLNAVAEDLIYLSEIDGRRFSFSRQDAFYRQADLFHYSGDAVYPTMLSQVIDSPARFLDLSPVATSSIPFWLALQRPTPWLTLPGLPWQIYPSFLVPNNLAPPYVVVHIEPNSTIALQGAPAVTRLGHRQAVQERVRVSLYGFREIEALQFLDYLNDYSLTSDRFGLMNSPVLRDEKQGQVELGIIANLKTLDVVLNYLQGQSFAVAKQAIRSAQATIVPRDEVPALYNNDGMVGLLDPAMVYPSSSIGLSPGAVYNNGSALAVVPGFVIAPGYPFVINYWNTVDTLTLLQLGAGFYPTEDPGIPNALWVDEGLLAISSAT